MEAMQDRQVFDGSPFVLTASPEIGQCWAGRPEVLKKMSRLIRTMTNRPDSTLDLLWANFGSGKSHALYHIQHVITLSAPAQIPVFVEIPEQIRHFIDLYTRIIPAMPLDRVASIILKGASSRAEGDLQRAARVIVHGNSAEQEVAREWLSGRRVHLRELKSLTGISTRIETDVQAADILANIVASLASNGSRLVVLLDEFQRLGTLQEKHRAAVLSNLRSLFSRSPTHLSVVLATTTRIEKTALDLLPQELRTLMGLRPSISLPEMSENEAYEFVLDRFKCFRSAGYSGGPADPIGDEAIRATIDFIKTETSARLIPRTLLQALSLVFDEMDDSQISGSEAKKLLQGLSWESLGDGGRA